MRWILLACAAVLVFDGVSALAAKAFDFAYGGFPGIIVSTAIYAFPAVMAVHRGHKLRVATIAGATVALVDATAGWAVSWLIGPGAPPADSRSPALLVLTATTVVVLGAVVGLAAAWITRRFARNSSARL